MGLYPRVLKTKSVLIFTFPVDEATDAISEFNPVNDFFDDGAIDQLLGGDELDWFWKSPDDDTDAFDEIVN